MDGGAEKSILHFMDACRTLGIGIELATASEMPRLPHEFSVYPLVLEGWTRSSKSKSFRHAVSSWAHTSNCDLYQSNEWAIDVDILRLGDGLHSHWLQQLDSDKPGIRSVIRKMSPFHNDRLRSEREALTSQSLKAIICNSELVLKQLKNSYPAASEKAVVIYNPAIVDASDQSIDSESSEYFWLGFAGSGWYRKGLDIAISALAHLPADVRLKVAGRDSEWQRYSKLANEIGVSDRVVFEGVVDDMRIFYRSIDALVHPARYDPCPNVAIEAISNDLPVIVSAHTGMADFDGESGLRVLPPLHSAVSVADAAIEILQGRIGLPENDFKQIFSFEKFCTSLDGLYKGLL